MVGGWEVLLSLSCCVVVVVVSMELFFAFEYGGGIGDWIELVRMTEQYRTDRLN